MTLFTPPSVQEWVFLAVLFGSLGLFIWIAEMIRKRLKWNPEVTRKFVHILTGVLIYFAPDLFVSGIPPIIIAAAFVTINSLAVRLGFLKGIHGTNRYSYGTAYYPLAFLILVLLLWNSNPYIISLAILVLAFADAAAAIVGENLRSPHLFYLTSDKKSVEGSIAMFLITAVVVFIPLLLTTRFGTHSVNFALMVACASGLFVTAWEAIASKGFDNLTVPLSAAFMLHYFLVPLPHHDPNQMILGLILGLFIAVVSYRFHFLSLDGSVATFLLAATIFGIGGWKWTLPILTFFILSSLLSKFGKKKKAQFHLMFEKSDRRDVGQVAANGGAAGILIFCWYMMPEVDILYCMFLASIAAVTADTWGTEIGVMLRGKPRSVLTWQKVETGTSGAVSWLGFCGAFVGAVIVTLSSIFIVQDLDLKVFASAVVGGLFGSLIDSLLGATIQAQYQCIVCKKITERLHHCDHSTILHSGKRWFDNDLVNWACALSGAVVPLLIFGF